jgi:2,3-bisphosphoglycerate-dependent phosphoglycerate mutase
MKIYILRHEDRPEDCSFFVPLTKNGLINARKLVQILKKENINLIFSSPYLRTLQTINPYIEATKYKVNLEYGLEEIQHQDIIPKKAINMVLPDYLAEFFNYNCNYETIIKPENIKYPETEEDVMKRFKKIIKKLITDYYEKDINILLVTHQTFCNIGIKIVNKAKHLNLSDNILNNYKKGSLTLIYDKYDWVYKPINY